MVWTPAKPHVALSASVCLSVCVVRAIKTCLYVSHSHVVYFTFILRANVCVCVVWERAGWGCGPWCGRLPLCYFNTWRRGLEAPRIARNAWEPCASGAHGCVVCVCVFSLRSCVHMCGCVCACTRPLCNFWWAHWSLHAGFKCADAGLGICLLSLVYVPTCCDEKHECTLLKCRFGANWRWFHLIIG